MQRYSKVTIENFQFDSTRATVDVVNADGRKQVVGFTVNKEGYKFEHFYKEYLRDMAVVFAISDYCLSAKVVVVDVPVTKYVRLRSKDMMKIHYSFLEYYQDQNLVAEIVWNSPSYYAEDKLGLYLNLDYNKAVIGWSGGKESIATYELAKEAGYIVSKATFNKPADVNSDSIFNLYDYGNLYIEPTELAHISIFKDSYFDFQGSIATQLLALLMVAAGSSGSGVLLMGGEFGTSTTWEVDGTFLHEWAPDEGYAIAKWLIDYIKEEHDLTVQIYSPVSTLMEVAIIKYVLDKGYKFSELKSCWNYDKFNCNCEACLKCNRLKMYGVYLAARGYLSREELSKAFTTLDYPDIATPELVTYSVASKGIISDIKRNNPWTDWASVWIDSEPEKKFTGERFLEVVKKYFSVSVPYSTIQQKYSVNLFDKTYVSKECCRYLGTDYIQDMSSRVLKFDVGFTLPFEWEVTNNEYKKVLDHFDGWEVYENYLPAGVVYLKSHRRPFDLADYSREIFKARTPLERVWMKKSNILFYLDYYKIDYEFLSR